MNSDQRLVAYIGLFLIIMVLWFKYKPAIKTILFDAPTTKNVKSGGSGGSLLNPLTDLKRVGGIITNVNPYTHLLSTNQNTSNLSTVTV